MSLDKQELEELSQTIIGAIQSQDVGGVPREVHEDHHDFIQTQIIQMKENHEMWSGVKKQVFGWGIIAALIGIGTALYEYLHLGGGH